MKLRNIIFLNENFLELITKIRESTDIPVKDRFKLMKLIKELGQQNSDFDEMRKELVKKYGKLTDKEKGIYTIKEESVSDFNKEFNELLDISFDVNFEKIPYPEGLNFSINELMLVEDLFDFEELEK